MLTYLNTAKEPPKKGDVIVIETKASKGKRVLCNVKDVLRNDGEIEFVLNKRTNSYFIWSSYESGVSWVWRVWNLGDIELTAATNSMKRLIDY